MNEYERVVYNFGDFLGDVGGMGQAASYVGSILVGILAARLYYAALIRDTFRVRLDAGGASVEQLIEAKFRNSDKKKKPIKPWRLADLSPGKPNSDRKSSSSSSLNQEPATV